MPSNDDFFSTRKAAAVFKHGILKRYPVVFASKTGRDVKEHRVVFLDGYAGRGEYEGGEPGSPLLLSRCAEYVEKNRNVLGVFVEQDDDNFANLERVLRALGGPAKRKLLHGSLDEKLPEALALAEGSALFAFLDPFGPALDFATIRSRLLSRPNWPRTEVLLHFSVSSVARMGGAVRAARANQIDLSPADRKTEARLNRFLGGAWWQDQLINVDQADERRATEIALDIAERYRQMLVAGTRFTSVSIPVRPRPDLLPKSS
jgi:three-Cys-motif partner protein